MTENELPDDTPAEVVESIEAARAATAAAHEQRQQVEQTRQELAPLWARAFRREEDSWGAELEAALAVRGTR